MKNLGRRSLSSILYIFLNIIWWAEWLFAACSIVVAVVLLFRKEDLSFNAPIHFSPVNFRTISSSAFGLPAGRVDISQGLIYLPLKCNPQNIAVALGILLAFLTFCILITYQLRKIFASFGQNEPFVATNARRIRNIGVLIIGYSGIRYLFDAALTAFRNRILPV